MRNGHFITDYHCHSTVSPDGHNTMREMAEAAVRLGVDDLCFTDHIEPLPWDRWNEPPKEKHSYDWAPMLEQFREAQEAVGGRIKLHMGAELGEAPMGFDRAEKLWTMRRRWTSPSARSTATARPRARSTTLPGSRAPIPRCGTPPARATLRRWKS